MLHSKRDSFEQALEKREQIEELICECLIVCVMVQIQGVPHCTLMKFTQEKKQSPEMMEKEALGDQWFQK